MMAINHQNSRSKMNRANGTKAPCGKFPTTEAEQCFRKYTLQDNVDALKNILNHNDKDIETFSARRRDLKKSVGVKECLQAEKTTPLKTIVSELKDTVMNSYWNREVGKTRYQVPNLPPGMNPLETTFGMKVVSEGTVADVLNRREIDDSTDHPNIHRMYQKSHNKYHTSEQINRSYSQPFTQDICFGKPINAIHNGTRTRRLLKWVNYDPATLVNTTQADFMARAQPRVGEVKNNRQEHLRAGAVYGKQYNKEINGAANALRHCSGTDESLLQQKYLQHVNALRQRLKRRIAQTTFSDIYEHMSSLDQKCENELPEDEVFAILARYNIFTDKQVFLPLIDILAIRKKGNINYKALVNLLNWKYEFPTLPKVNKIPAECQYYNTTYNDTICNLWEVSSTRL